MTSLPSRERGLKFDKSENDRIVSVVAPFAGAWIEIWLFSSVFVFMQSLPSRERGLKSRYESLKGQEFKVAPFAGAWIEMQIIFESWIFPQCRSLRGSVD